MSDTTKHSAEHFRKIVYTEPVSDGVNVMMQCGHVSKCAPNFDYPLGWRMQCVDCELSAISKAAEIMEKDGKFLELATAALEHSETAVEQYRELKNKALSHQALVDALEGVLKEFKLAATYMRVSDKDFEQMSRVKASRAALEQARKA